MQPYRHTHTEARYKDVLESHRSYKADSLCYRIMLASESYRSMALFM